MPSYSHTRSDQCQKARGKVVSAVLVTMLYIFSKFPWLCGGHRLKSHQKQEKNVIFGVFLELMEQLELQS
jgi:hypothetical protein